MFISEERLDFIAIQETKLEQMEGMLCEQLWGDSEYGCVSHPASGSARGILSMWNAGKGSLIFSFSGSGFLGVCLEWGYSKQKCFVVNIYAPCNLAGKRKLWEDLKMSKRGFGGGRWCLVGDFNAVSRLGERKGVGGQSTTLEMEEFRSFSAKMELIDLPLLGRKFKWYRSDGSAMSRLDRFLLSDEWFSNWGVVAQWALRRDVCDHCPIMIKMGSQDWGQKPLNSTIVG